MANVDKTTEVLAKCIWELLDVCGWPFDSETINRLGCIKDGYDHDVEGDE